jgi:site-specific recombinase XerD
MRLNAVKKAFGQIDLDQIGSAELKAFFETLGDKSARSFNNYLAVATTFFRWATKQGYLPSGWKEIESIEWVNDDDDKQITTLNAEEVTTLLAACSKSIPRHPDVPLPG